jgi:hypothetical protein
MSRRDFLLKTIGAGLACGAPAGPLLAQPSAAAKPAAANSVAALPDLAGIDAGGRPVRLADYKGKACLISFFTSGCNICIYDLKLMREFNKDNRNKDFVMIGVSLDEQRSDYLEYTNLIGLSVPPAQRFPLLWRKAPEHRDSFGPISQMPTHFALNKSHQLALTRKGFFRSEDWDDLWLLFSS